MNPTLIIVILGIALVLLLGMGGVWYGLFIKVKALRVQRSLVEKHFAERNDLLPLLVEAYRRGGDAKTLERLITHRQAARLTKSFAERLKHEQAIEETLKNFIKEARNIEDLKKDLIWLEARTELQKTTKVIGEALEHYERARGALAAQSLRFPARLFRGVVKRYL